MWRRALALICDVSRSEIAARNKNKLVYERIVSNCAGYNGFRPSGLASSRNFHSSLPRSKREDRREMLASMPKLDEGTLGERIVDIDALVTRKEDMFPNERTFDMLFNGVPFAQVPVCNIRVSKNNTIISITDHKGAGKLIRSCGIEGFKNARKGTNIAAQATAISFTLKALEMGYKTVRVRVRGLGPGRMSAIKGLQMAGLNIISVTDNTPVSWNPPRPRKQRRL